jgi:hypothetical protein
MPGAASAAALVVPWPSFRSLACRSIASSNPNPTSTSTHGTIAAVRVAGRCGIRIDAA